MKIFFYDLKNTSQYFLKKEYLCLLILGSITTYFLVVSGFDWWYFLNFKNPVMEIFFFPGIIIGAIVPFLLPFAILGIGKMKKDKKYISWAGLLGQSAFLGWLASSIIKSFTGRLQPNLHNLVTDISHNFNFGFWQHGIFWGWPSSHTTVAFSVVAAIITVLLNKNRKININNNLNKIIISLLIFYAFYIGVSVSLSIHWFSDFVMGMFLGAIVGYEVGKSFRKLFNKKY